MRVASSPTTLPTVYRGRFAPSPTGPLHVGSVYTALASFLEARAARGLWFLRLDDLDPLRSRVPARDSILFLLDALGLHWDGAVLLQSQRLDAYQAALTHLSDSGLLYPCTCSRKHLEMSAVYPGTCRGNRPGAVSEPHALRIRVGEQGVILEDRLQGRVETCLQQTCGDFVVYRRDGVFGYHLATVVDDAYLGITDVLRGVDLLAVTPQQIYLRQMLRVPQPSHLHIPVLVDGEGFKLSKQTHAPAVSAASPSALLLSLLALLQQHPPPDLIRATPREILDWAIAHWNPERLSGIQQLAIPAACFSQESP